MKLANYILLLGIIIGNVNFYLISKVLDISSLHLSLWPLGISIVLSVVVSLIFVKINPRKIINTSYYVRPLIYWPTIALIAAFFTKGLDLIVFGFWFVLGILVGGIFEFFRRKKF